MSKRRKSIFKNVHFIDSSQICMNSDEEEEFLQESNRINLHENAKSDSDDSDYNDICFEEDEEENLTEFVDSGNL